MSSQNHKAHVQTNLFPKRQNSAKAMSKDV